MIDGNASFVIPWSGNRNFTSIRSPLEIGSLVRCNSLLWEILIDRKRLQLVYQGSTPLGSIFEAWKRWLLWLLGELKYDKRNPHLGRLQTEFQLESPAMDVFWFSTVVKERSWSFYSSLNIYEVWIANVRDMVCRCFRSHLFKVVHILKGTGSHRSQANCQTYISVGLSQPYRDAKSIRLVQYTPWEYLNHSPRDPIVAHLNCRSFLVLFFFCSYSYPIERQIRVLHRRRNALKVHF